MPGTVLGAGDSESQDRNSQLVGKTEMQYRGFCREIKIICRGLPVWGGRISKSSSEEVTVNWGIAGCIGALRQLEGELGGEGIAAKSSTKPRNV